MRAKNGDQTILVEAEQKILGIALHSPYALPEILSYLTKDDFLLGAHKLVYQAIENLYQTQKTVDSTTVIDYLEKNKNLTTIGGALTINDLSATYYGDDSLSALIEIIFERSMGRKFDQLMQDILQLRQTNPDLAAVLNKAQVDLLKIDLNYKKDEVRSITTIMDLMIKKIKKLEQNPYETTGVPSGFNRLDKITSGFQRGDLIILAARPSMGKTAFALNLAYNAAIYKHSLETRQNRIAIFSLEMPHEQLSQRLLAMMGQIEPTKLRTGQNLSAEDWRKINAAYDRLATTKIFIDDTPGLTVQQLQTKLQKLKRDEKVNFCLVDYLQLISTPGGVGDRQNEIAHISRQLKRIARDLGMPIVCLSQLSRSVEKREDRRPMMSDLRDSGAIEQDADLIMFLYRESYYERKENQDWNPKTTDNSLQETELIISKHRNGATGTIKLSFNLLYGKFLDLVDNDFPGKKL